MRDYKDSKSRGRVEKKNKPKIRLLRLLKIASILAGFIGIVLIFRFSQRYFLTSNYFGLEEIVVTGAERVSRDEVIALSRIRKGENIIGMDLKKISERIEGQPWIEGAAVRRVLPRGLIIRIRERVPFAILKEDRLYYVDRGGIPFKELDERDEKSYPLITGLNKEEIERYEPVRDTLMKTLDFIETEADGWPGDRPILEFNVNRNHGITVISKDTETRIGFGEYKVKIQKLKRVLDELKAKERTAGYIDLTYTGQVVVRE